MADDTKKKRLNRRSFMATVLGGVAATGATTLIAGEAQAQQRPTGRSDSDSGYGSDPAGRGYSGLTDSDSGSNRDRAGHGRGRPRG